MRIEYRSFSWWYWVATDLLLAAGVLGGRSEAFLAAMGLTTVQIAHFIFLEKKISAFPVQVRAAFLMILAIAFIEPLRWLYWIPLCGTAVMVLFGYCPLARTLSLLPWNRREPFSLSLVRRTFLSPPTQGSILQGLPTQQD